MILSLAPDRKFNSMFSPVSIPFLRLHKAGGALLKMNDPVNYVKRISEGLRIEDGYTLFKNSFLFDGERCYSGRSINEIIDITPEDGFQIPIRLIFTYLENKQ